MTAFKSDFLRILQERGFIHQISDPESLDDLAARQELVGYIGFDCTAPSLHVGSMVQIMCLYWLQQTGNKPIALMGGGTTRVGDPSGKDETRKILSIQDIERNKEGIKQVFSRFLDFSYDRHGAIMPDNAEWLTQLNWIEMLRDIGRHFSVNRMLSMDSVKLRLERDQEMSFIEFNYMILQAYDYVVLNKRYNCRLQMGGSDQWGNIVNGIDLGRRMGRPRFHALTTPLITTSSGEKMGKTASGAVWLNSDMKSPYEYWQFWRNTEDADVERFLKLFTRLPLSEIRRLATLQGAEINEAKKRLATEATALLHGRHVAEQAEQSARLAFEHGGFGTDLKRLSVHVGDSLPAANTQIGFSSSNAQARKLIESGAVYLGERRITNPHYRLSETDFDKDGQVLLSSGKRFKGILMLKSE
ncbi:MAG: tyrosine--tRNA ligase [Bradyrhizobium sp.]